MAFVVVAEFFRGEGGASGETGGEGGASAKDAKVFFGSEADHLVEIAVDRPGVNEVAFGELRCVGLHACMLIVADAGADEVSVVVFWGTAGEGGEEMLLKEGDASAK